ncbi:MAG: right-handed parallel beta-helix repeat-containing protein, partial [Phycisphaerae bacterium]|nr:right-handed parallel beta-helix repeat-containing protein [Phycisphaerae bacterium]
MKIIVPKDLRLACWIVWLATGIVWADHPGSGAAAEKHRFDFLERSGFESLPDTVRFTEMELSDRVVYSRQRTVVGAGVEAIVQGDHVAYHFDRNSGRLKDFRAHWRNDIPELLPDVIDKDGAEAKALDLAEEARIARGLAGTNRNLAKIRFSGLYYLKPDSEVVGIHPAPENPCWIVETEQAGVLSAVVIDAIEGRIAGPAIPPPAAGFSFTGPVDISGCSSGWFSWYTDARDWFEKMGYATEMAQYPTQAKMIEKIQSLDLSVFYEMAHGGSTSFGNGCSDSTTASEVTAWLTGIPAVPFTFLGSCDGMCSTGAGTLSYAFRKGSMVGTATVGYCGMSNQPCIQDCWYDGYTIPWQTRLFKSLSQGKSIKEAFDIANADYPGCAQNNCMRLAGDPNLRLAPIDWRIGQTGRIYVDVAALGSNDGTSWTNAYTNLVDALGKAEPDSEVWVAAGTYRPRNNGLGRETAFVFKPGVAVYGGFLSGDTEMVQRNPSLNVTVLSGDMNRNDTAHPQSRTDNLYHVAIFNGCSDATILDGFTISGGNANWTDPDSTKPDGADSEQKYGGGIICINSRAVIRDCVIRDNSCSDRGGGIFVWDDAQPTLERCRVINNSSGILGGGIASYGPVNLDTCTFEGNTAQIGGGLWGTAEMVAGCRFIGNTATLNGGGVYAIADMTIENGLFADNQAASFGGGIYGQDCDVVIRNCTLSMNQATRYGGAYNDGGTTLALNSILWNNTDTSNDLYRAQIHGL